MDIATGIVLSFLLTLLLFLLRALNLDSNITVMNSELIIGWCVLMFSIILGFAILIFYNRYIEVRNTLVDEVINLQIIYRTFTQLPNSEQVLKNIKNYVESVLTNLKCSLKNGVYSPVTEKLYRKMDLSIIQYFSDNPTSLFISTTMDRLSTCQKIKAIDNEITTGNFYIKVLWFLFIFVLIPLYFDKMPNKVAQTISEFCLLSIFTTGIVLCDNINNPFADTPVALQFTMYSDLLSEINTNEDL